MVAEVFCVFLLCKVVFGAIDGEADVFTQLPRPLPQLSFKDLCQQESRDCSSLEESCFKCSFPPDCAYGDIVEVTCQLNDSVVCSGDATQRRVVRAQCRYCFQIEPFEQRCEPVRNCTPGGANRTARSICAPRERVVCMGARAFYRNVECNWTSGYRWSTALALSVTLGGFGADRFYLGLWKSGLGKLFSFGGLGVWTLVDVVLVATGYVGPADGSVYI